MGETSQRNPLPTKKIIGGLLGVLIVMQLLRFVLPALALDNPPVTYTAAWNSPEAAQIWQESCADCHSNETRYPWYSYVAPMGWVVSHYVQTGRSLMNLSTGYHIEWDQMLEVLDEGRMPPPLYISTHPAAELTAEEKTTLEQAIIATFR